MTGQAPPPSGPAASQPDHVQGERHVSAVVGRGGGLTKKHGAIFIACAAGAAAAFILARPEAPPSDPNKAAGEKLQVRQVTRYTPPALPPEARPVAFSAPAPKLDAPALPQPQQTTAPALLSQLRPPQDPLAKARHAPLLAYSAGGSGPGPREGQGDGREPVAPGAAGSNELSARLQPTQLTGVRATVLRHQPYLLTRGTAIPCTLETALDSTQPGFVSCRLPQAVLGKTGITLLDRHTLVTGEFHGGIRQGQARLFVLWTRAETPNGVIVDLNSPATDALGRSGFDGEVDNHFWQRFGGALLLSLVSGAAQTVTQVSGAGTYVNTGNAQSVAKESLDNSVNIRPTLTKNQGELVSIYVARDLDFHDTYEVNLTRGSGGASR